MNVFGQKSDAIWTKINQAAALPPPPPPSKNKKKNVFGQKSDAIRAKINHTNFICTKRNLLDGCTYYPRN